jgi:hypothetical protein
MLNTIKNKADVNLMASILTSRQLQGDKCITRREMFDYVEHISPRDIVAKQKFGVNFSDMLQQAAGKVEGAKFVFDTHPNGKRKNVRVEL